MRRAGGLVNGKKNEGELGVGELEGAEGAMAPIVRVGEDEGTMRARLVCEFPFFFWLGRGLEGKEGEEAKPRPLDRAQLLFQTISSHHHHD